MHNMKNPKITQARAAIRLAASELPDGDTARVSCPFCGGGRSKDEAFYITRLNHYALYVCHRATCGKRGRLALGDYVSTVDDIRKVPIPKPWTGALRRDLSAYWQGKYDQACLGEFKRPAYQIGLYANADWPDETVWLLHNRNGQRIGVQTRRDGPGRKVVRSHKETPASLYNYFGSNSDHGTWIVEDCLSAAALNSWGRRAVALLGTFLHDDVRADITYSPTSGFIVALDPGAERDAGIVKQRLSCYTTRPVHVLYMPKDFKNMNEQEQFATLVRGRI